jgi:hypothetical protein
VSLDFIPFADDPDVVEERARSLAKPSRVERMLQERKDKAEIKTARDDAKREAKARDSHRCRWPKEDHETPGHVCLGQLESAHQIAIGMGGEKAPLSRTSTSALFTACALIHQHSPESLERHGRSWVGLTDDGADGPVAFLRRDPSTGEHVEFARERFIGVLETI